MKEIATERIRVYPSTKRKLRILVVKAKEKNPKATEASELAKKIK